MAKVSLKDIDAVTRECLSCVGVPKESIEIVLSTIHYANRRGVPTHGVGRLPLYVRKIKAGHFNPKDEVKVISEFGATAVLDANGGFGQVAAYKAVEIAMEKAKQFGIAVVGVRNSNNFGTAGYFGDMAAKAGMAAMIYANAAPAIAPTGGTKPIFGTNPICYAFPGGKDHNPIVLDMATTVAARGKIRLAAKNNEKIPFSWAADQKGQPTDDPNEALKGTLLPIAGYKGYGLSAFVDLFAGVLTGSASAGDVKQLSSMDEDSGNGHLFILIDVKRFISEEEMTAKINRFSEAVKACGEDGKVFLPGERGYTEMEKHPRTVIISDMQLKEINELSYSLGIATRLKEIVVNE